MELIPNTESKKLNGDEDKNFVEMKILFAPS